jgi:tape measure domain-containing protein
MSTVISKYAYKATWDASELSKGLMNSRALFQQQKKIVEDSRTPFDRLAIGQENLNKLIEKYPELASQKLRIEKELEKQYLLEESAVRKLDAAERQRLNTLLSSAEKQERAAARMEKARARVQQRYSTFDESSLSERMSSGPNWAGASSAGQDGGGGVSMLGMGKAAGAAAAAVAAYKVSAALKEIAVQSVEANKRVERAEITFEHFSGSAEMASNMLDRLRQMSAESGVSFSALSEGTSRFMAQRFEGDDAIKTMRQIAEVTGGIPERMDRLSYAFAQVRSKGQLYAEELQQLNEAGFSPLKEIAEVLGVEMGQVRKEIEKGNVTWDVFAKAIDKTTESGGRFNGFLDKFKGTSLGSANESAAAWEDAYSRVGKALEPISTQWAKFSTMIAKDIGNLASGVTGSSDAGPDVDAKADRIAKREKELADQRAANRKREQDAIAAMEARNAEQATTAISGLKDQQFDQMKQLVPDEELRKFEKVFALLTDYNKEQAKMEAIENFKGGLGLGDFSHMLGEEAKQELKKTEQLEKQLALRKKQQSLLEQAQQTAARFASEEQKQVDALAELELARRMGGLSQQDFNRAAREIVATDGTRGGGGLASSMRAGSQEAYQFAAGVQDRGQREKVQERQENKALQERMIKAIEKVEAAVLDSGLAAAG